MDPIGLPWEGCRPDLLAQLDTVMWSDLGTDTGVVNIWLHLKEIVPEADTELQNLNCTV